MLLLPTHYNDLDIGIRNECGQNLLHQCIDEIGTYDNEDAVKIAEILIDSGTSVNSVSRLNGWTLLHYSVSGRAFDYVRVRSDDLGNAARFCNKCLNWVTHVEKLE